MDQGPPFRSSCSEFASQVHAHVDELEASAFIVAVRTAAWQNRDHGEVASEVARRRKTSTDESRLPTLTPAGNQGRVAIEQRDTTLNTHSSPGLRFTFAGLETD